VSKLPKEVEWRLLRALAELIKEGYRPEPYIIELNYNTVTSGSSALTRCKHPCDSNVW